MPQKDWTLLVFMAGDNDLDAEGERDLEQLKSVDVESGVNLVVQFDRADSAKKTRRYVLRHGSSLVSDSVEALGETNTGDPEVLEQFLLWGIRRYPAKRYFVVIWNHGGGVDDSDPFSPLPGGLRRGRPFPAASPVRRSFFSLRQVLVPGGPYRKIAVDEQARDFLDNVELKKVFRKVASELGRPVDLLGMDACLMNMVEIGWQLRDSVRFIVGSQDDEPGAGWPYDTILAALAADPKMKPERLSEAVVDCYLEHFRGKAVTQSSCDVSKLPALISAIDDLAGALLGCLGKRNLETQINEARLNTLQFADADFIDLHHLCTRLRDRVNDEDVRSSCTGVQAAVEAAVHAGRGTGDRADAHGLSIYFPLQERALRYAELDFTRDCRWADFLEKFIPRLKRK